MRQPTLYKKNSNGTIQEWTITTEENVIITRFGQLGGKIQAATDVIAEGKNTGKKNATTATQQAEAEALAQFEKKLKKGYVMTLDDAQSGKVDAVIEGGIFPMLAHRFDEQGHKIEYPAYAQPKFDGHRCIAVIDPVGDDAWVATLWSRTRKQITGLPHIVAALERMAGGAWIRISGRVILDGELYNHAYRSNFEELTSFIRNPDPKEGHEVVQFHIYDIANNGTTQEARVNAIRHILQHETKNSPLVGVETVVVDDEDDLMLAFERFLRLGYEGLMVRNARGMYVNKRSYDLLKVKEMLDDEFEVVGVEAGRGKMADKAIFICKTKEGVEFKAKMKGTLDSLKQYITTPSLAVGKMLTVQYQGITGKSKVPRFPVGLRLRDDL